MDSAAVIIVPGDILATPVGWDKTRKDNGLRCIINYQVYAFAGFNRPEILPSLPINSALSFRRWED